MEFYEHFKISDTDGAVLNIPDLLKIKLQGDNEPNFDTTWSETIIAMQKQPDEKPLIREFVIWAARDI